MQRRSRIRVVVLDETGNALTFAYVTAEPVGGSSTDTPRNPSARTDGYGRATILGLEAGVWRVFANAKGHERSKGDLEVEVPGDAELEIVLKSKPVEELATVVGTATTQDGGVPRRLRFADRRGGSLEVEGGRFRLTGVAPGRTEFVLRAEDCVPYRTEAVQLYPGGEYDLGAIELAPASRVHVEVLGPDGERLQGASARLIPLPVVEGGTGDRRRLSASEQNRGRFRFVDVPRASWALRVDAEGYRTHRERITVAELDERFTVTMRAD